MFAYLNVQLIIPMDLYGKERWDGRLDASNHPMPPGTMDRLGSSISRDVSPCGELQRNRRAGRLRSCG